MRFISLFATAVCVLSVNAASLSNRAVTEQVQLCRSDIDAISNQIKVVVDILSVFTSSLSHDGAIIIHDAEQVLEEALKKAGTDCCAITGKITDEEADAMLDTVTPVIPQATSALDLAATKKPEFSKVPFAATVAKADILAMNKQTVTLYTCVHDIGSEEHPTYIPTINNFISQLDNSFALSLAAYQGTPNV